MSTTEMRLAERALEAQYVLADIREGNPWYSAVITANMELREDLFVQFVRLLANQASTFVVSSEMTELIKLGAENLIFQWLEGDRDAEVLLRHDPPTPFGWVLFSHQIDLSHMLEDESDREQASPVVGFLWTSTVANRPGEDEGVDGMGFIPVSRRGFWEGLFERGRALYEMQTEKGTTRLRAPEGRPPEYVAYDLAGWTYDQPWRISAEAKMGARYAPDEVHLFHPVVAIERAILWTFFRLVDQRIGASHKHMPGKKTMKRVGRKKPNLSTRVADDGGVRIVKLRREQSESTSAGEGETNYSHRWIVQPHWAKRRVATRDHEGTIIGSTSGVEGVDWTYRRVFIAPYVKGPEHAPLVLKETVNVLAR